MKALQIKKAKNEKLNNSFWLLDETTNQARCLVSKVYKDDEIVNYNDLGVEDYKEVEIYHQPTVKVEGGQHLNVNVLRRETLSIKQKSPNIRAFYFVNRLLYYANKASRSVYPPTM